MSLKGSIIRLAYQRPALRKHLLPLVSEKTAAEEVPLDVQDFLLRIERTVKRYFPRGHFGIRAAKGLANSYDIYMVTATLPKGKQPNGIMQNDPSFNTFWMFGAYTPERGMNPKIKVEMSQGGKLYSPNAFKAQKIGWRDKTGTPAQIIAHFDRYYATLASMVE